MTKDEALKLALEALEYPGNIWHMDCPKDKAITAIKEALAQPEPVIDKSAAIRIATSLGWEPKRTWVGLTEKEYKQVINAYFGTGLWAMAKNIEAKLKEKNNG